jgi:hypothetical protein
VLASKRVTPGRNSTRGHAVKGSPDAVVGRGVVNVVAGRSTTVELERL